MTSIFGDDEEGFHRGFVAGVFWQKLHENRPWLNWTTRPYDVRLFTRMAQSVGYRVTKEDHSGGHEMTFTSTSGG
jgi:hypothetical protein